MERQKGLLIKCPQCGKRLNIRTSERPSACLTQASVYCIDCNLKATIHAQLSNIQLGEFFDVPNNYQWEQDRVIQEKLLATEKK